MRIGWIVSALAHAAFLFAGYIVWPREVKPLDAQSAIVPVEVVTFADKSNVTAIAPPEPLAAPIPQASGAPLPTELEKAEPTEVIPDKIIEEKPKKPDKPKNQQFSLDQLSLLIDRAKKNPGQSPQATSPKAQPGEKPRQGFGAQDGLATTERDALRAQLSKCWRAPVDMPDPARLVVRIHITLTREGALAGQPQLVTGVMPGDGAMRVAADNALRAVRLCAPFDLPAATYDRWRDVIFTFDPREMIGQ